MAVKRKPVILSENRFPSLRPRRGHRTLRRVGITLISLVVLIVAGAYFFIQRTLPSINGTVRVAGLNAPVEVDRDRWGVPHIFAQNARDAYFTQGYVTAQDRLWQMELFRRTGRGTLSEILGKATLNKDLFLRTLGMRRAGQMEEGLLDDETRQAFEAYSAGVNAFVETHRDRLPLEFTILGFQPDSWSVVDSLTWAKMMAWDLGGNWTRELLRANLVSRFGPDAMRELAPAYPDDGQIIVPPEINFGAFRDEQVADLIAELHSIGGGKSETGSNNWVVDGSKSTTGKPLLANDPHLSIQMPAVWYEVHLSAPATPNNPALNVIGASFPGVPGVIIGHNDRIAWGMTNVGPDVQDLFVEKINPDNPHQYLYQGKWEDMQTIVEEIKVKGAQEPVRREVLISRHGPLINGVVKGLGHPVAFRWTALDPGQTARAIGLINRAQDWDDFRVALRYFAAPAQNFVYADIEGNIGYQMPGQIPIRAKGDGLAPAPGWTGEYDWQGFIPFDRLPSVYNPAQHFLFSANNRIVDASYPYLISNEWDPGYRAQRISTLIQAKDKLSADDFRQMQADTVSLPDQALASILSQLQPKDADSQRALEHVRGWDGTTGVNSIAASIVETTFIKLLNNVYADAMGDEMFRQYLVTAGPIAMPSLLAILGNDHSAWFRDARSPAQASTQEVLLESLRQAVTDLQQRFGSDPKEWRWGRLHTATFDHVLGQAKPLDRLFSIGPYEHPGSNYTLNSGGYSLNKPFTQATVASLREIIDLADFDRSLFVYTTGQSGQPLSSHFGDLAPLWLRDDYHPMLFSRDSIEREREGRLVLTP